MRMYNTTWNFLILKKKRVLQDCNAIKPSEWAVRSGFLCSVSLLPSPAPFSTTALILLEPWDIFLRDSFLGLLSTRWYQQSGKLSSFPTPLGAAPFTLQSLLPLACLPRLTHLHCTVARQRKGLPPASPPLHPPGEHDQEGKRHRTKCSNDVKVLRQHWHPMLSLALGILQYYHGISTSPLKCVRITFLLEYRWLRILPHLTINELRNATEDAMASVQSYLMCGFGSEWFLCLLTTG